MLGHEIYGPLLPEELSGGFAQRPMRIPGVKDIVELVGEGGDFLALTSEGRVWSWGGGRPGLAKIVARAGAPEIATGSWAIAAAHGKSDGEELPLAEALTNAQRILEAVDFPVSVDLESGYGPTPEAVAKTVAEVVKLGAAGFNRS